MKKVLVVGGGGREHAIVYALSRSPQVEKIYCAPGNAGIAQLAECVAIKDTDVEGLLLFAKETEVDLTVVGPEAALAAGVVDAFRAEGMSIFGHTKAATQIESSKEFAKIIMQKYDVPTAAYQSFSDYEEALAYVQAGRLPIVLKYDGLAAGKGVVIANTLEEADLTLQDMLCNEAFGKGKVVVEEFLEGPEFSFMCFVNGENVYPMPLSQDHKRAYDNDKGPNTGGMGAYTPLPFVTEEDEAFAKEYILEAVAKGMCAEGLPLTGVLYGGLMKTAQGIKVIEFNARFGDPETEVVLPLLESDAYDVFYGIATGDEAMRLKGDKAMNWRNEATIGVVLASKGYPGDYTKGAVIEGTEFFDGPIFHMGTKNENGVLKTNGGRVMMCIATGKDINAAREKVYNEIEKIQCPNLFYRKDIAHWAL
ncbi:MAG: phosphoribosylamine--glycine ligase [Paludibacteraceae bacterium]|nr:phosphoribosylamine--glycine ligase [Paludibacteraceae bacterium]